ncbi:MAG: beta-galactosidase trimerization domain-containing protein, partial [Melioribacteraceae bacterium]|nr:beta-galactosidase trimerization domain-containing protein [Melioribacteraceae bacterium]
MVISKNLSRTILMFFISLLIFGCSEKEEKKWEPNTDWGHWILGHKSDPEFLEKNNMTITFGSGAPNVDEVTRAEFDSLMEEAKKFNESYHYKGYIVLRYLSTSLNGNSESNKDIPKKEQINFLKFYNDRWADFEDYIGPKPEEDPTTWIMVRTDGSFPYYRYARYGEETDEGFEAWGVPVNPGYLRMMEGRIRAQAETGIDGSYIDWTHIAEETSYDEYSKRGFIAYLNKNLPSNIGKEKYGITDYEKIKLPEKRGEKFWMEWITYRGTQVAEFHKHMRTVARKYNPHFMVSGNVFGGFGFGPIAYLGAGNIEMLGREGYDDFIYSEMQEYLDAAPRNKDGVKITNSPALKYVSAAAHGKPVIVYATEITKPIFPNPTEKCLSAMSQIKIAEAVANQCIFREKRETPQGATDMYSFLAKNRPDLIGSKLYSNIGILGSINQYLADEQSFAFSTSRVFTDKGISHVFIVEDDLLTNKVNQFDLIVLPNMPLLSLEKQNALVDFVNKGGNLIVLGATGIKDQYGLANKTIPLLVATELSDYPKENVSKSIGKGK